MYIPENRRDTRYPLWFVRYEVTVPYIQSLEIEEIEEYGIRTSGDPHHDHATQWEPVLKLLPIHLIAELYDKGANVRLRKQEDAVKIYHAVQAHLLAWKNHIETSFNPPKIPEEDLLILDRFATAVYDKAAPFFTNQWVAQNFRLAGKTRHSRRAIMDSINKKDAEAAAQRDRDRENGVQSFDALDVITPLEKVVSVKDRVLVDYSGKEQEIKITPRKSLTSFLRRQ